MAQFSANYIDPFVTRGNSLFYNVLKHFIYFYSFFCYNINEMFTFNFFIIIMLKVVLYHFPYIDKIRQDFVPIFIENFIKNFKGRSFYHMNQSKSIASYNRENHRLNQQNKLKLCHSKCIEFYPSIKCDVFFFYCYL